MSDLIDMAWTAGAILGAAILAAIGVALVLSGPVAEAGRKQGTVADRD